MTTIDELIEKLNARTKRVALGSGVCVGYEPDRLCAEAAITLTSLQERNRKLEEALRPFAEVADAYDDREGDDLQVWIDVHDPEVRKASKLGHFRRARALLSGGGEG